MQFSKNFSEAELVRTSHPVTNLPPPCERDRLFYLATFLLQPIRDRFGEVTVSSGFRCEALEKIVARSGFLALLKKHGLTENKKNWETYFSSKQHPRGEAADIIPVTTSISHVFKWVVGASELLYGQCIYEKGKWIHISLPRIGKKNKEALVFDGSKYEPYRGQVLKGG